jgi:putative redox protein
MPRSEKFDFPGHDGAALAARLDLPDGPVRASALFAHCFACSKDIEAARRIARRLAALGLAILRFDFTGLGHSGGEFENTAFSTNVADLVAAAAALEARVAAPQLLIGHSLGGAAALAAAARTPSVRAVATIGAPADVAHTLTHLGATLDDIRRDGVGAVTLGGKTLRIGRAFVEEAEATRLAEAVRDLRRALLILHAPRDSVVGVENATTLFLAARHPKSFVTLDDADHLLTRPADAEYAADVIAAWASRYLEPAAAPPSDMPPEGVVRSAEADPTGFLQDISADGLVVRADEPAAVGGSGLGFTPYQLLSAALAACTSMTIRLYARRKGLAVDHVAVDVTHDKVHAADCADCETKEGRIDRFRRVVRLSGSLTEAERARLLEIADRCPVHRTLEGEARIETTAG